MAIRNASILTPGEYSAGGPAGVGDAYLQIQAAEQTPRAACRPEILAVADDFTA